IAMKKLRENGYITMAADGIITLNASGLEIASSVYGRHTTITRFFTLLGVAPDVAAEDACKVEHDLSDETFRKIQEFVRKRPAEPGNI
ncbi:MAG: iron dependent repressor, metal binding and dimerization domain protein, partial [Oscillibacter sp.]